MQPLSNEEPPRQSAPVVDSGSDGALRNHRMLYAGRQAGPRATHRLQDGAWPLDTRPSKGFHPTINKVGWTFFTWRNLDRETAVMR
jgi:hypothetical protein